MKNLLLYAVAATTLHSCATTNKSKSSHKEETKIEVKTSTDSATTNTLDSAGVRRTAIISTTEKEGDYTLVTTIEFDTTEKLPPGVNTVPLIDGSTPAEDYGIEIDGVKIKGRVKGIIRKETGHKTEKTKTEATGVDSSHKQTGATTDLSKKAEAKAESKVDDKNKKVFRIDATGLVIGSIILLLLIAVIYYYRQNIKFYLTKVGLWPKKSQSRSSPS